MTTTAEQRKQISEDIAQLTKSMNGLVNELAETDNEAYAKHLKTTLVLAQNDRDRLARKLGATPICDSEPVGKMIMLGGFWVTVKSGNNFNYYVLA